MKNLFLCSYFAGVKNTFKDFMNNDTKGKFRNFKTRWKNYKK